MARFGKFGHRLALFAHGEDDRSVTPYRPVKSISAETTFGQDTASGGRLREVAQGLCDRVAAQLARKGVAGSSIVLKLKTSDFRILTRSRRLAHPTQRAAADLRERRRPHRSGGRWPHVPADRRRRRRPGLGHSRGPRRPLHLRRLRPAIPVARRRRNHDRAGAKPRSDVAQIGVWGFRQIKGLSPG